MSQSKYKYYKPLEKSHPPSHTLKGSIFVYLLNGSYFAHTLSQREVRKEWKTGQYKITKTNNGEKFYRYYFLLCKTFWYC